MAGLAAPAACDHTMPNTISWVSPGSNVNGPDETPKRRSAGVFAVPLPSELYSLQKSGGLPGNAKSTWGPFVLYPLPPSLSGVPSFHRPCMYE